MSFVRPSTTSMRRPSQPTELLAGRQHDASTGCLLAEQPEGCSQSCCQRKSVILSLGGSLDDGMQATLAHRPDEFLEILLVLIGVGLGEVGERLIKTVTATQVFANQFCIAAAGMGARQDPAAVIRVDAHRGWVVNLDHRLDLYIMQLANIEMPPSAAIRPSQAYITSRLHQPLPNHDALAVIVVMRLAEIWFEHRRRGLF